MAAGITDEASHRNDRSKYPGVPVHCCSLSRVGIHLQQFRRLLSPSQAIEIPVKRSPSLLFGVAVSSCLVFYRLEYYTKSIKHLGDTCSTFVSVDRQDQSLGVCDRPCTAHTYSVSTTSCSDGTTATR
jgi:hypothetical protein